ncbi:MAG: hypothetical protein B7X02_00235 [Rhodospirillales bacterium 12-54-5]|nr:MAG: hypothetical protein B7X02_00235 [Rhodospirillales bacterium 12-54-5]
MRRRYVFIALGACALACSAQAQLSPEQTMQLSKAIQNAPTGVNLQQGIAVATLLDCTQKKAGKQATEALYAKMQAVSSQANAACNAKQPSQARALLIQAFHDNHDSPVVAAANDCYTKNKTTIDALAGTKAAPEIAKYVHLLNDPGSAERVITEANVCKKK